MKARLQHYENFMAEVEMNRESHLADCSSLKTRPQCLHRVLVGREDSLYSLGTGVGVSWRVASTGAILSLAVMDGEGRESRA
jgi:hypothetical protein